MNRGRMAPGVRVRHWIFLFNLVTLGVGLAVAGVLFRGWRAHRGPPAFWQFLHFAGFSFTMTVAALDAYCVVNLASGWDLIRFWTSLVLVGSAVMLFAFPHWARAAEDRPRPGRFTAFWGGWALVPLVGAVLVGLTDDYGRLLLILGLAFTPFWASILYGLAVARTRQGTWRWEGWVVFSVLALVAAGEVFWVLNHPPVDGYFFFTLPLAYLFSCWSSWRDRPRGGPQAVPGTGEVLVPEGWAREQGLTAREREVAAGILRGLSNKELAYELGLSENTVRNHIANLYAKVGIQKRMDLVLLVRRFQGS